MTPHRMALLASAAVLVACLAAGCGNPVGRPEGGTPESDRAYIRGEVIEVTRGAPGFASNGNLGTILVEGARSSPVDEALLTVTPESRITDRRSGRDRLAGLDAVEERQTVEARFTVVSSSPHPWRAEINDLLILP